MHLVSGEMGLLVLVVPAALLAAAAVAGMLRRRRAARSGCDPVTGLAPWRQLGRRCREHLAHARRQNGALAVIMVDIDRLRDINASGGVEAGDAALRIVARALALSCRRTDLAVRGPGDELVLLAPATTAAAAALVGHRLQETLSRLARESTTPVGKLSASIGIADLERVSRPVPDELLAAARTALQHAKRAFRRGGVALAPRRGPHADAESTVVRAIETLRI